MKAYRNSFVLYESVQNHFERLKKRNKELALEYISAILNYGIYGNLPEEDSELWDFGLDTDIATISAAKNNKNKKIQIPREELEKHINNGLKQKEIAEIFNCSVDTIQRRINEYGITANRTAPQNHTAETASSYNGNVKENVYVNGECEEPHRTTPFTF